MPARSVALLVLLGALWGGSFVFMRVAVPALGPIPLAYVRVSLAAIALLALAFAQRRVPPFAAKGRPEPRIPPPAGAVSAANVGALLRTRWREFAVVGVVNSALPFALFCYAEQYINASTGALLNATSPFFAAMAAAVWLAEPLTVKRIAGMALGLAGVVVLVGWHPEAMTRDMMLAVAACLAAAICYALAGVYTKRKLTGVPSFAIACASQVTAAVALMPALPFTTVPGPLTPLVVANVAGLAFASTALAYLIYFKLIADAGPQRALTVTFLIPLFGVLWGALFLDEPLTFGMLAGGALIVGGVALALRR